MTAVRIRQTVAANTNSALFLRLPRKSRAPRAHSKPRAAWRLAWIAPRLLRLRGCTKLTHRGALVVTNLNAWALWGALTPELFTLCGRTRVEVTAVKFHGTWLWHGRERERDIDHTYIYGYLHPFLIISLISDYCGVFMAWQGIT